MRVAIANHGVFPDVTGGMERHTYNLAKHLQERGVDVDVLVPDDHRDTQYPFPIHRLIWPSKPFWLWSNYCFSQNVGEWIDKAKPDIAFGQGFNLWAYLKRRRIPCIFHPHGLEMFGSHLRGTEHIMAIPFRKLVRYHGANSDVTVSLGGKLTSILRNRTKISTESIVEIPNAVDVEQFRATAVSRLRNSFLFVGRFAFNKGIDLLSRALRLLPDEDFQLTLIGDGPMRASVERLAAGDKRVGYISRVDDNRLKEEFAKHECLLFTSRFEGMPTVILEAMASGCCVVATDIGAVNAVVNSKTGILIDPCIEGVSQGIRQFLSLSSADRRQMSYEARARVRSKFSWARVVGEYQVLFEKLVT